MKRSKTVGYLGVASLAVALVLIATATSVAGTSSQGSVRFTWWTFDANPQAVVANFEKAYPSIHIDFPKVGANAQYYTKLTTDLAAGSGPCVAQIEYDHLPQYMARGLVDISKYDSKYRTQFPGWVWNQVTQGSALYAMPEDIGPMGLLYQPSVLRKYHLPVPTTWKVFASDAVKLHGLDPHQYLTYFPYDNGDYLMSLFWQAGAQPFKRMANGSWKIEIDGPIERKVISYWGRLVASGAVPADNDNTADFAHHVAVDRYIAYLGAAWSPTYEIDEYVTAAHPQRYAVAALPQWSPGATADANWGGSSNAVTKSCPSKDVTAGALFAAYINTSPSGLAIDEKSGTQGGRGLFPASISRAKVPQFKAPIPNFIGNINATFAKLSRGVVTTFQWSPWTNEFDTYVSDQLATAAAGRESWTKALKTTQQEVVAAAKTAGYSVQG